MGIKNKIDGVWRNTDTADKLKVKVDGVWRSASALKTKIDGVWRDIFDDSYNIYIYVYGTLTETLNVPKGSSINLPSKVDSGYSDDTFYGYSTTSTSTTRTYTGGQTIIPSDDMNLYCIYSYSIAQYGSVIYTSNWSAGVARTAAYGNVTVTTTSGGGGIPYGTPISVDLSGGRASFLLDMVRQTGTTPLTKTGVAAGTEIRILGSANDVNITATYVGWRTSYRVQR